MLQGTQVDDPDVALTRKPSDSEPFSALAFKIMSDAYQGTLTFIRVYSGILEQVGTVHGRHQSLHQSEVLLPESGWHHPGQQG